MRCGRQHEGMPESRGRAADDELHDPGRVHSRRRRASGSRDGAGHLRSAPALRAQRRECGQNLPASMSASVTWETRQVSTAVGTPGAVDTILTGSPVVALTVSTSSPEPPNTAGPAVIVSV